MAGLFATLSKLKKEQTLALSTIIVLLTVGLIPACSGSGEQVKTAVNGIVSAKILSVTGVDLADRVSVVIESNIPLSYSEFRLTDPVRLIIDFPDADLSALEGQTEISFGKVTSVRAVQFDEYAGRIARLEIALKEVPEYDISSSGNSIVIDFFKPAAPGKVVDVSSPSERVTEHVSEREIESTEPGIVESGQAETEINGKPGRINEPETRRPTLPQEGPKANKRWKDKPEPEKTRKAAGKTDIAPEDEKESDVIRAKTGPVEAYGPGEYLEFVLKWAGIVAGDSTMIVENYTGEDEKEIYRIISTAKSRSLVD
ncbi:MAG: AMIN domain-containing protein, partial [bacterium]